MKPFNFHSTLLSFPLPIEGPHILWSGWLFWEPGRGGVVKNYPGTEDTAGVPAGRVVHMVTLLSGSYLIEIVFYTCWHALLGIFLKLLLVGQCGINSVASLLLVFLRLLTEPLASQPWLVICPGWGKAFKMSLLNSVCAERLTLVKSTGVHKETLSHTGLPNSGSCFLWGGVPSAFGGSSLLFCVSR